MKHTASTTLIRTLSTVALVAVLLAGCGTPQAQSNPAPAAAGVSELNQPREALDQGLVQSGRLALGTLELEATAHAVNPSQAAALLPLWQAIRSGTLQSVKETDAVRAQIEGVLSDDQLAAIAAMQLTGESLSAWAEERRLGFGLGAPHSVEGQQPELSPEQQERFQQPFGGEAPDPKALEAMREQFSNMTDEQRQEMRANMEASGTGRAFGGGIGQAMVLLQPLIDLLTERAGALALRDPPAALRSNYIQKANTIR